jgi:nicotinic acid mononucleotide adenylyltransferase
MISGRRAETSNQPPIASRQPPAASGDFIEGHALSGIFLVDAVTPDVSSTAIRKRLAAGEPITGLVPAAVERHIVQHGLYTEGAGPLAADHLHGEN